MMAKLTETAGKNKQYNDLRQRLARSLPEMAVRMEKCSSELLPGSDPQDQLEQLQVRKICNNS